MIIYEVNKNKEQYMPLLLLADKQKNMINRYLYRGIMYVLDDGGIKDVCIVTKEKDGLREKTY